MSLVLPFMFAGAGLKTPTQHLDANFQAIARVLNEAPTAAVGVIARRPAPSQVGALYVAADQHFLWYVADGTVWHPVGRAADGHLDVDPDTGNVRVFSAAVGDGAQNVLACATATGVPTSSPPGLAQLYVSDTQGVVGRASWHHRSEDGWVNPVNRTLFRRAGNPAQTVGTTSAETSLFLETLRGGTVLARRSWACYLALEVLNNSGVAQTLTLRTKYAGTTLTANVLTFPASGTLKKGVLLYRYDALTDLSQVAAQSLYEWDILPTSQALTLTPGAGNAGVDQPMEVTAQFSAALATLVLNLYTVHLTLD